MEFELPKKNDGNGRKCLMCHGYGNFKVDCPSQRAMTLQEIKKIELKLQEIEHNSDHIDSESEKPDEVVEQTDDGELLVIRRALQATVAVEVDEQRENIFQTRCTINGKLCELIIDGENCTNVAPVTLIEKLKLPTSKHPKPYKLQWLSKRSDLQLTKQAHVSI